MHVETMSNEEHRICVDTGKGCSLLLTSPLAASQNFEVSDTAMQLRTSTDMTSYTCSTRCQTSSTNHWRFVPKLYNFVYALLDV
jgi:hypothetical protein